MPCKVGGFVAFLDAFIVGGFRVSSDLVDLNGLIDAQTLSDPINGK